MKLLVLTSTYPRGANDTLPNFVHELCARLVRAGHEVHVLMPRMPGAREQEDLDGVQVRRFPYWLRNGESLSGPGGIFGRIRQRPWRALLILPFLACFAAQLRMALRRERYDLVHAHWLIPQGLLAALVLRGAADVPLICTAHGSDVHAMRGALFNRLRAYVVARSRIVAVVSAALREQLIADGIAGDTVVVASMGVDFSQRFCVPSDVARDPQQVLFVGRLVPDKGVATLLEAVAALRAEHLDCRLTIVGDGPDRSRLEMLARTLAIADCVSFTGAKPQAELPAYYARAAIAVLPSFAEGFGLVSLEAMGCGCAVIASDLPALRSLIVDEQTGLLFTAGDAAALAERLRRLLTQPQWRATLAQRGRASVAASYDWPAVVERYARLYEQVLAGDNPPSGNAARR